MSDPNASDAYELNLDEWTIAQFAIAAMTAGHLRENGKINDETYQAIREFGTELSDALTASTDVAAADLFLVPGETGDSVTVDIEVVSAYRNALDELGRDGAYRAEPFQDAAIALDQNDEIYQQ